MNILQTINKFQTKEHVVGYMPLGNGHINETYLVMTKSTTSYVIQKINHNVFKDVDLLMDNIYKTTSFLSSKGYETLELMKTKDGKLYYFDGSDYYRLYIYIDNVVCYEGVNDLDAVYNAAKAFGMLHKSLRDFDASTLGEVIPNFHNTQARYENFLKSLEKDVAGRAKTCQEEIANIQKYKDLYSKIYDYIKTGEVKLGVTHNDPKINNVLFDKDTNEIRAVIDLDTVMPGSYLFDYGDALRSLFTGEFEDSKDLSKINIDYPLFEMYTRGYLSEMKDVLTKKEVELLPFAVFLLTAELVIRFLTDYLDGDTYFKTSYPEHNLVRARTQMKLMNDIYNHFEQLDEIVQKCYRMA